MIYAVSFFHFRVQFLPKVRVIASAIRIAVAVDSSNACSPTASIL